jgi:hypothetical protein
MNVRRMLYYDVIYLVLPHGIVWGQSTKALTRQIVTLQKRPVRYTVRLKELELCRDSFRQVKILTVYSIYIQETILYAKQMCNCAVNK